MRTDYFRKQAGEAIAQGLKKAGELTLKAGDYIAENIGPTLEQLEVPPEYRDSSLSSPQRATEPVGTARYKTLTAIAQAKELANRALGKAKNAVLPRVYDIGEDLYIYGAGRTAANQAKKKALEQELPLTAAGKKDYEEANFVFIPSKEEYELVTGNNPNAISGEARKYKTLMNLPLIPDTVKEKAPTQILLNEQMQNEENQNPESLKYGVPTHELAHYYNNKMTEEQGMAFDNAYWKLYKENQDFRNFMNWRASSYLYREDGEPALGLEDNEKYALAGEYINMALQGKLRGPRAVPRAISQFYPQVEIPEEMLSRY